MGWISERRMKTGSGLYSGGTKRKGPLRKIVSTLRHAATILPLTLAYEKECQRVKDLEAMLREVTEHADVEGWVIIHPNCRNETAYFDIANFKTKMDGYQHTITPEEWRKSYRPDCNIVRKVLVPADKIQAARALLSSKGGRK